MSKIEIKKTNIKEKKGLGRGLAELLGDGAEQGVLELNIELIIPNIHQPRKNFDIVGLEELRNSIQEHGLLQPILVRKVEQGMYEIIAGERRWRASKMAGLSTIPVIVKDVEKKESLEIAIVENLQRMDVSPIESAHSYQKLLKEFGYTQDKLAKRVGKSRPAITNTLRLLQLSDEVQKELLLNTISEGHAKALLMVDEHSNQTVLLNEILTKKSSVRDAEKLARTLNNSKNTVSEINDTTTSNNEGKRILYSKIEEMLSMKLGLPVKINPKEGNGKLYIEYYSEDNLQHILDLLNVSIEI